MRSSSRRAWLGLAAALCVCAALPGAAPGAAPAVRSLGTVWGAASASAGGHDVLLPVESGPLRVARLPSREVREYPVPAGCRGNDVSNGRVLVACSQASSSQASYSILSLRTRALRPIPGDHGAPSEFQGLGRYWAIGTTAASGRPQDVFMDWRSGAVRADLSGRSDGLMDPDTPELDFVHPCAFTRSLAQVDGSTVARFEGGAAVLRRCGRPAKVLDRCRKGCDWLSAGGGLVTWIAGATTLKLYEVRSGRLQSWRFLAKAPRPPISYAPIADLATGSAILSVPIDPLEPEKRVYQVTLRR